MRDPWRLRRVERRCALQGLVRGSQGSGGAARPQSRATESGLQKWRGQTECVLTASGHNIWNVISQQLCSENRRARGQWEEDLLTPEDRDWRGNKSAGQCHLPCPSPSQNPKRNKFPSGNLLAPCKHPTLCFCGYILWTGRPASLPVLEGPSCSG